MNPDRLWTIGSLVVAAAVLAGGWFLGVSPAMTASTAAEVEREGVVAQNALHEATLAQLTTKFSGLGSMSDELALSRASVPAEADMSAFLRQVDVAAVDATVSVTNVTVSDAVPYLPAMAVVGETEAAPDVATADGAVPAADATASADDVRAESAIAGSELVTADVFSVIPVTLSIAGDFSAVFDFVQRMQSTERLFLVTGISITTDSNTGLFSADIEGYTYVLSDTSQAPSSAAVDPVTGETVVVG